MGTFGSSSSWNLVLNKMIYIRQASPDDMPFIKECIDRFRLDDEDLDYRQFIAAMEGEVIVGFGRIRPHNDVYELASVGVVDYKRNKGIGRMIVKYLIEHFPSNEVYITTDIPEYFERFGFSEISPGPKELVAKLKRVCKSECREGAAVMVYKKGYRNSNGMQYSHILTRLKLLANPEAVRGMARYGINPEHTYGISIPNLRKLAKEIGKDHVLSQELWLSGIHEARILAGMIDDPEMVTEVQMERWVKDFDSWDVCDQCCMNLFEDTKSAYQICVKWSSRDEEFVKRAGFVLMARLAVSDKNAKDQVFLKFLPVIKREATDNRNFVKKAINWALRQIGKRNINLNKVAIRTAKEIQKIDSKSAKWIATDAIRELTSKEVQKRLHSEKVK